MKAGRQTMHIVSSADADFLPGLELAVASTVAAATGVFDYHFHILDGGLPEHAIERLAATIARIGGRRGIKATLELRVVDQSRLQALPERRGSRMTYAKLILPEMLPDLDAIVYLDADVLCYAGIEAALPPVQKSDWLLSGVRDYFGVIEKDCPWLDQLPVLDRKLPYINCGIMGMNLRALREIGFTDQAIAARVSIGNARQGDQSVFNYICRGKSFLLPPHINHFTSIGSNRPLCEGDLVMNLHYIGSSKPWLGMPTTSNWLAHQLWHQARQLVFAEPQTRTLDLPHDLPAIRRKACIYRLLNPKRAADYRSDMLSLEDPGGVMLLARNHWLEGNPEP
jgi:lipopolysaccharide biosynthesis glycosyltransferase